MPVEDIRLRIDFRNHPKTKRLIRVLGDSGVRCLVWLWLGAAARRANGELYGWDAEEIELEADWNGPPHGLVDVLLQQGWLEKREDGLFVLHDWKSEQPFVTGAPERSQRASHAARKRWDASRIPSASTPVDPPSESDPDASRMPGAIPIHAPTLPVPTQECVGPGGSVVAHRDPDGIKIVEKAYELSGLFPTPPNPDFANCGLFYTWVNEWLDAGYPGFHIAQAIAAVRVAQQRSGGAEPQKPLWAIRSLVNGTAIGKPMEWTERTAGDGTSPRKRGHSPKDLRAEAARLAAEGK